MRNLICLIYLFLLFSCSSQESAEQCLLSIIQNVHVDESKLRENVSTDFVYENYLSNHSDIKPPFSLVYIDNIFGIYTFSLRGKGLSSFLIESSFEGGECEIVSFSKEPDSK